MKCVVVPKTIYHLTTNIQNNSNRWLGIGTQRYMCHLNTIRHGTSGTRPYSSNAENPEVFTDYEWHRKWMENESRKFPVHYNFARDIIDKWAIYEKVFKYFCYFL